MLIWPCTILIVEFMLIGAYAHMDSHDDDVFIFTSASVLPCLCDALNRQSKRVRILEGVVMEAINFCDAQLRSPKVETEVEMRGHAAFIACRERHIEA